MMAFAAAANLFLTALDALLIVFLVRDLGESAGAVGLAMSLSPVGGVLGAMASRRLARALGSARAIIVCALGGLPFALLVPLAQRGWGLALVIVANAALAAGVVAANVIVAGFQQAYVPRGLLGRVSACSMTAAYSTMPVGALLAGVLAGALGMRPTLWMICAGLALCGAILLPTPIRRRRDLPGPGAAAAAG